MTTAARPPPFPALPKFAAPLKPVEPEPVHATNRPLIVIGKKPVPPEVTNSTTPIVVSEAAVTNTSPPVESRPAITPPALAPAVEVVREPPTTDIPTPAAVTNLPSAETPPPSPPAAGGDSVSPNTRLAPPSPLRCPGDRHPATAAGRESPANRRSGQSLLSRSTG